MSDLLARIFQAIFHPPTPQEIPLPFLWRKTPGVLDAIRQTCETFYLSGVKDGFMAGLILALFLFALFGRRPQVIVRTTTAWSKYQERNDAWNVPDPAAFLPDVQPTRHRR